MSRLDIQEIGSTPVENKTPETPVIENIQTIELPQVSSTSDLNQNICPVTMDSDLLPPIEDYNNNSEIAQCDSPPNEKHKVFGNINKTNISGYRIKKNKNYGSYLLVGGIAASILTSLL